MQPVDAGVDSELPFPFSNNSNHSNCGQTDRVGEGGRVSEPERERWSKSFIEELV